MFTSLEELNKIKEMAKDYKLCCMCEMFDGYIDDDGNKHNLTGCIEGTNPENCVLAREFAEFLIKQGFSFNS